MKKKLCLCIAVCASILLFVSSLTLAFEMIPVNSHRFPGRASDGSEAYTQKEYKVLCNDGHEIACLMQSYERFSGIAVGCAKDDRTGVRLYVTDRDLMKINPSAYYLPSASVESIGSALCINAAPEGSR